MVRIASFATAAASLAGLVGAASNGKSDMRVPGGFIFEFTDMVRPLYSISDSY